LLLMLRRGLPCRLHLIPVYRAPLLNRGLGWGCPPNLFTASLLWFRARGKLGVLPGWRRRHGTLSVRRPLGFLLRRPLPILLRWHGGRSRWRRLLVLPYLRIARLVTVILVVNIALLLHLMRIAIPGILALVGR
jgi:hypothetical protein